MVLYKRTGGGTGLQEVARNNEDDFRVGVNMTSRGAGDGHDAL